MAAEEHVSEQGYDVSESVLSPHTRRLLGRGAARLAGKVALVTGSGSRPGAIGTGAAIAVLFAAEGGRVAVFDTSSENADRTCDAIAALGGEAFSIVADITDQAACQQAIASVIDRWGALDVLVNNVGVTEPSSVLDVEREAWQRVISTNLTGPMSMLQAAAPSLRVGGGTVVSISSISAIRPAGAAAYSASKAALIALTQHTAAVMGPDGVRANCILPGRIHAPMTASFDEKTRAIRKTQNMLKTEGDAWDVAWAAVFLASDEARWITGVALPVDAGVTIMTPEAVPK